MENTKVNTNSGKVNSRITWQGVEVSGPRGKVEVKITGDEVEATPKDSFIQGVFKGAATTLVGPAYPLFTSLFKGVGGFFMGVGGYSRVRSSDASLEDRIEGILKTGSKGAAIGSLKGFAHGFVDFLAIGTLSSVGGLLGGPVGATLGAVVGGGVYNLLKDGILKEIKETYESTNGDIKKTIEKNIDNIKEKIKEKWEKIIQKKVEDNTK
jgi:hypothetical protein